MECLRMSKIILWIGCQCGGLPGMEWWNNAGIGDLRFFFIISFFKLLLLLESV